VNDTSTKGGIYVCKTEKNVLIFDVSALSKRHTIHLSSETQKVTEMTTKPIFFFYIFR